MKTTRVIREHRKGMTLVEVMLGIAIMAILAILAMGSFFYPRWQVVTYAMKQNAINAGTAAIEQLFAIPAITIPEGNLDPAPLNLGNTFSVDGRSVGVSSNLYRSVTETDPYTGATYRHITVAISYPGGSDPVTFETYRSSLK